MDKLKTLTDVIKAIRNKMVDTGGFPVRAEYMLLGYWDLDEDFDGQKEETKKFIKDLLLN